MAQPDWNNIKAWKRGQPMSLLEAFGFSKFKLTYPQLKPQLPNASAAAQQPIQIAGTVAPGQGQGPFGKTAGGGPGGGGAPPPAKGPIRLFAKKLLSQHGWPTQFGPFNSIVIAESGWNPKAKNLNSGAFGIAQALGHGGPADQGTMSDNYGGFGLTHPQAKLANSGNPFWQLVWMMNYIQTTYGSPANAWKFHQSHGWY